MRDSKFEIQKRGEKEQPPCIEGMKITINSVLQLTTELSKNYNTPALKTRRINQDPLENLFATIRQQYGCSVNPSPMQFETGLRHSLITQLTKVSSLTNCEIDENKIFAKLSMIKPASPKKKVIPITQPNSSPNTTAIFSQKDLPAPGTSSSIVKNELRENQVILLSNF